MTSGESNQVSAVLTNTVKYCTRSQKIAAQNGVRHNQVTQSMYALSQRGPHLWIQQLEKLRVGLAVLCSRGDAPQVPTYTDDCLGHKHHSCHKTGQRDGPWLLETLDSLASPRLSAG